MWKTDTLMTLCWVVCAAAAAIGVGSMLVDAVGMLASSLQAFPKP